MQIGILQLTKISKYHAKISCYHNNTNFQFTLQILTYILFWDIKYENYESYG